LSGITKSPEGIVREGFIVSGLATGSPNEKSHDLQQTVLSSTWVIPRFTNLLDALIHDLIELGGMQKALEP
jgi:hypothetical protein